MSANQVENIILNPIVAMVISEIKTFIHNVWSNTLATIIEELVSSVTLFVQSYFPTFLISNFPVKHHWESFIWNVLEIIKGEIELALFHNKSIAARIEVPNKCDCESCILPPTYILIHWESSPRNT